MSYLKTIGYKNNNYTNIKASDLNKWKGETTKSGDKFESFQNPVYGMRAFYVLMDNYIKDGHNTIEKVVSRFAPPSENDTSTYISQVEQMTGIDRDSILDFDDKNEMALIGKAFVKKEIGYDVPNTIVGEGYDAANSSSMIKKELVKPISFVGVAVLLVAIFYLFKFKS